MTTTLLRTALNALESVTREDFWDAKPVAQAIDAIRTALAQPAAEPVGRVTLGWDMVREQMFPDGENNDIHWLTTSPKAGSAIYALPLQAQPSPDSNLVESHPIGAALDGMVLVPREATQAMCAAAVVLANGNAVYKNVLPEVLKIEEQIYAEVYEAMLAAAPQAVPEPVATLRRCACEFDGDTCVTQCNLHAAHVDAIHEWAERAKTAEARLAAAPAVPDGVPDTSLVICPNCCTQFRAIPQDVQRLMIDAGFEPPFVAAPVVREQLTNGEIYTAYIAATNQTLRPQDERLALAFARAIEQAHGIGGGGK